MKYVDVFLPNEREAKAIARTDDLSQALNLLAGLSKIVVVKCGARAAICRSGDEQWSLAPPSVQMVDDIGAGDTFDAGFIHAYLQGAPLEDCLVPVAVVCSMLALPTPVIAVSAEAGPNVPVTASAGGLSGLRQHCSRVLGD